MILIWTQGIAFCEYASSEATPIAVEGLNEVVFGETTLKANLASIGFKQAAGLEMGVNAMSMFAGTTAENLEDSRVLQLLNMVTPEELIDNDEYEGKHSSINCLTLLITIQKSVKMSRKSARNMDKSWTSRSRDQLVVADNPLALAKSSSSSSMRLQRRRLYNLWLAENLLTAQLSHLISTNHRLMSVHGK